LRRGGGKRKKRKKKGLINGPGRSGSWGVNEKPEIKKKLGVKQVCAESLPGRHLRDEAAGKEKTGGGARRGQGPSSEDVWYSVSKELESRRGDGDMTREKRKHGKSMSWVEKKPKKDPADGRGGTQTVQPGCVKEWGMENEAREGCETWVRSRGKKKRPQKKEESRLKGKRGAGCRQKKGTFSENM